MESQESNLQSIISTYNNYKRRIIPASSNHQGDNPRSLAYRTTTASRSPATYRLSSLLKSLFGFLSQPVATLTLSFSPCKWLSLSSSHLLSLAAPSSICKKVTATLFGPHRGHVSFAIQEQPRSDPVLLLELAISTSDLVREMSSGQVRITRECEKRAPKTKLFHKPTWTMYCNGHKCGYATPRESTELDLHVLRTIQNISVGAGVVPMIDDDGGKKKKKGGSKGEVLYMRAKFERVVGNQDSEAYYMLNPDGNGGPELSIFLLRIWCIEEDTWGIIRFN